MKNKIYTPIIGGLLLAFGIMLGNYMGRAGTSSSTITGTTSTGKIDYLLKTIDQEYVDSVDVDSLTEVLIPKLLEELDPHTSYIPAKDLQGVNEQLQGNFGGIGVQFRIFDDTVMVMHVIDGGPSQKSGVQDGDRIIAVDDSIIAGTGTKNADVMDMLRGEQGTSVKVGVFRPSTKDSLDIEIKRGTIPVNSVDVSYMMNSTTGYIKVDRFGQFTYTEFLQALGKLKKEGCISLIIDLRGNTGGYLGAAIGMINEFLPRGEMIVYTDGKSQKRQEYKADGSGSCQKVRVAVLMDEWSASASEIFAGAIQDNDRGIVIGRRSFGKGLVQNQSTLPDGSALRLTIARYYTPSGRCIQKDYEKGNEDYAEDLWNRFMHGEMDVKDSIHFNSTEKFETKDGRIVYASGGIMPDVFIPRDTLGVTDYSKDLARKSIVTRMAFFYADTHRQELRAIAQEGGIKQLHAYLEQQGLMKQLLALAKEKEIPFKTEEYDISKSMLETQLHAFIAQNIMDSDGFYPIIKDVDNTLIEAERIMSLSEEEFTKTRNKSYTNE